MHKVKPRLIVMVGLPASGKSSYVKKLEKENPANTVVVSSEAIREEICGSVEDQSKNGEVFRIFHERIRRNLEKKKDVIADATNITMKSRRAILNRVNGLDVHKECYIMSKPFGYCLEDNKDREHPVPERVLYKQLFKFQIPFYEEGWDYVSIVARHDFDDLYRAFSVSDLFSRMYQFDQKNPHHNRTLDEHCYEAYECFCKMRGCNTYLLRLVNHFAAGALLHDIGKVFTQKIDEDGIAHYYGHAEVGSYMVLTELQRPDDLRGSMPILDCCFLINYHMLPFGWNSEKSIRKWRSRFGDKKFEVLRDFHQCDIARGKVEEKEKTIERCKQD